MKNQSPTWSCRTVLNQIYDDEDEDAHVGFVQRLWAALCELTLRRTLSLIFSRLASAWMTSISEP
jgi:hypothetical protein